MPMKLPEAVYIWLKWLLVIVVPAFGTLYSQIADPLGLDNTEVVLKILFAVATFLGLILGISTVQYNASDEKYDGVIDPNRANLQTSTSVLDFDDAPRDLDKKKEVLLKVKQVPPIIEH